MPRIVKRHHAAVASVQIGSGTTQFTPWAMPPQLSPLAAVSQQGQEGLAALVQQLGSLLPWGASQTASSATGATVLKRATAAGALSSLPLRDLVLGATLGLGGLLSTVELSPQVRSAGTRGPLLSAAAAPCMSARTAAGCMHPCVSYVLG
jgi:hypothetical protein